MLKEGWGHPGHYQSRKWHYFREARSLCGKWMFTGVLEQGSDDSPDNCASCKRKRAKEKL